MSISFAGAGPTVTAVDAGNFGSAYTVDFGNAQREIHVSGTLNANCVLTIQNAVAGCRALLIVTQDATGGRSLTLSSPPDGSPYTTLADTQAGVLNVYEMVYTGSTAVVDTW